jgi:hypothetical protein
VYGKPKKSKLAVKLDNLAWQKGVPNPIGEIFSAVDPASLSQDNHPVVLLAQALAGRNRGDGSLTVEQAQVLQRNAASLANDFMSDIPRKAVGDAGVYVCVCVCLCVCVCVCVCVCS